MNNFLRKEYKGDFLTVALGAGAGVIAFILAFTIFSLLFFADNHEPGGLEEGVRLPVVAAAILGSLIAGYVTTTISTRKHISKAALTGILLILVWLIVNNFSFPYYNESEKISTFFILPASIVGGWWGLKRKQRKTQVPK